MLGATALDVAKLSGSTKANPLLGLLPGTWQSTRAVEEQRLAKLSASLPWTLSPELEPEHRKEPLELGRRSLLGRSQEEEKLQALSLQAGVAPWMPLSAAPAEPEDLVEAVHHVMQDCEAWLQHSQADMSSVQERYGNLTQQPSLQHLELPGLLELGSLPRRPSQRKRLTQALRQAEAANRQEVEELERAQQSLQSLLMAAESARSEAEKTELRSAVHSTVTELGLEPLPVAKGSRPKKRHRAPAAQGSPQQKLPVAGGCKLLPMPRAAGVSPLQPGHDIEERLSRHLNPLAHMDEDASFADGNTYPLLPAPQAVAVAVPSAVSHAASQEPMELEMESSDDSEKPAASPAQVQPGTAQALKEPAKQLRPGSESEEETEPVVDAETGEELLKLLKAGTKGVRCSNADIGAPIAASIAELLRSGCAVRTLLLPSNELEEQGALALASGLAAAEGRQPLQLTRLNLSWNQLGAGGARWLAEALKQNSSIRFLDLSSNELGVNGAKQMAGALIVNRSLRELDLSWNQFGDEGGEALAMALKINGKLRRLNLSINDLARRSEKALIEAKKANPLMAVVVVDGNDGLSPHVTVSLARQGPLLESAA